MPVAQLAFRPAYRPGRRATGEASRAYPSGRGDRRHDLRRAAGRSRTVRSIAIVGAGLAGLSAARAARAQGFDGALTVIGAEAHRPYDRPPLSKEFLAGTFTEPELALETAGEDLDARWMLGRRAVRLDPASRAV